MTMTMPNDDAAAVERGWSTWPMRADRAVGRAGLGARAHGRTLVDGGGLLQQLTKRVLEGEMDSHLVWGKRERAGRVPGNARNGRRVKTVLTEAGPVELDVPR